MPTSPSARPAGLTWADLLEHLVAEHGTLAQVAWKLVAQHPGALDVASVERALRRLRTRGQRDGGAWGQRLVRAFGVPQPLEDRVRWLGHYHSAFHDLPVEVCLDQLRLWDRPPCNTSRARLWVELGFATCATRTRRLDDARAHARRVEQGLAGLGPAYATARVELALLQAYCASREPGEREHEIAAALDQAEAILPTATAPAPECACFVARIADQRAYHLNRRGAHGAALALYAALPEGDVHPFASYRRDAGLAYGHHATGDPGRALAFVLRAIEHAGDGGYTRLRAMGLLMLARIAAAEAAAAIARARAIATRLGDEELLARCARAEATPPRAT